MKLSDFDFELPENLIAHHPLSRRDASRMLVVNEQIANSKQQIKDDHVQNFINYIQPGDVVVFNNSRVIPARFNASGYEITLHTNVGTLWWGFAKKFNKLNIGDELILDDGETKIIVRDKNDESGLLLEFITNDKSRITNAAIFSILEKIGKMPLPPYMKREEESTDRDRYQTIYAQPLGSMAAPTAGLHFTNEMLREIESRGAKIVNITLHVGAGTWLPVKHEDLSLHKMHGEWGVITQEQCGIINSANRVIAIGTTSLRLLESAARTRGVSPSPLRRGVRGEGSIYNNQPHHQSRIHTKQFARNMRNEPTIAENKIWQEIKQDGLGVGFRRQFSIDDKYIADFVCLEKKLIIEIDGAQHQDFDKDEKRTRYLKYQGFRVIRFWNWEVIDDIGGCIYMIQQALDDKDINAVYDVEIQPIYDNGIIVGFSESKTKIGESTHAFLSGQIEPSPLTPLRKGEGDTPSNENDEFRKGEENTLRIQPFCGTTDIFITPGYQFRAADVLLTNFHLPKSTLFMLVSAFAGTEEMKAAYAHAVLEKYRFFSYGDCCLLFRKN